MKLLLQKIKINFFIKNHEFLIIVAILLVAAFFRLWHIRDYIVFLGDEGRDMIVMRNIFINHNLPFLGPTASVGGFYLGPIYYWMAAPFLLLSAFDPVGPAYMVALMGILTVYVLFKFLKELAGFWPAAITALLYSTAPLIVRYSRSSWNPNPLPLFSLLIIYFIYRAIKDAKLKNYLFAGACFGVAIQLHYLALIIAPISLGVILFNENLKKLHKIIGLSLAGFIATFSPFLLFEVKNNFPNFRTILEFSTRGSTIAFKISDLLLAFNIMGNTFFEWISDVRGTPYTKIIFFSITIFLIFTTLKFWKNKQKRLIYSIGLIWLIGGIFLLRSYRGQLHDYYTGVIFVAPFFAFGLLIAFLWKHIPTRFLAIYISVIIFSAFISNSFYIHAPNRLIEQTEDIVDQGLKLTDGKEFNFALVSDSNSDQAYRYILEIKGYKAIPLEEMVTDQLIVLCENPNCQPLGNPLWEVAAFGRAEIEKVVDLEKYHFKLFKLKHWTGAPSPAGKPAIKGI